MAQERRRSLDEPIDFRNFPSQFDIKEPRMKQIVDELLKICDKTTERKVGSRRTAGVFGGVGVACFILAPFTAGASLAAAAAVGAAAAGAAGGVIVRDRITDRKTLSEVKALVEEFCDIAQPLMDVEKKRREMTEKLDRNPEEVFVIEALIDELRSLFIFFIKDSTVERLQQVTQQCTRILKKLEDFRRRI
ncbi:hypothetical protein NQD34_009243 [Periophthalmus magnuspinnatus]|nr:hypothetical protein NQD34_009243 [Periophthalmus magnuspinnatus]